MTRRDERGVALLEVLVSLLVLSLAGLGTVGLITAALHEEHEAVSRERALASAERVLAATTLLTRSELDIRIGRSWVGNLLIDIQRPEQTLYRIAVSQRESPDVEDLVTVVYRAESLRAP